MEKTPVTPQSKLKKRSVHELYDDPRPIKRSSPLANKEKDKSLLRREEDFFSFRILLPNGTALPLRFSSMSRNMGLGDFLKRVKDEYQRTTLQVSASAAKKRPMNWDVETLHLIDIHENEIKGVVDLNHFEPKKCHILRLDDDNTSGEAITYENMWDLTPDTELLRELPEEYDFETALADLIDNSLQAVWSNKPNERKLISVRIDEQKIKIFDTGPGMDGSPENCIAKWGKMGASLHRLIKGNAIGGKPPYLKPYFGMFGYGGPVASMHLGRRAVVSSKTKQSKKVYMLKMERESLLSSHPEHTWKTEGGVRNPKRSEKENSPHGSFTTVEIFEPKMRCLNIKKLQCCLKDIYFPYIQCDELSKTGNTVMPIEFVVNGTDLAEIESGEIAVTNLLSCKGPDFTFHLHFSQEKLSTGSPESKASMEANARVKCMYFPIIQGKESIEIILKKLEEDGCGIAENYPNINRISVRRLGRLLPEARWAWLPFMELKLRRGSRGQILKRCSSRVKCFIDTDSGINPNPSKTNLAHHHAFTVALKSFGSKSDEKETGVRIKIIKDGKELNFSQLEKQYEDWIFKMHEYDEEIETGQDEATVIIGLTNKEDFGLSSDVVRVYKRFRRKGELWESGHKIKILKGACAGFHNANVFATLEYIVAEGLEDDVCGEARLICRPMDVPDTEGCILAENNGNPSLEIQKSISAPISIIASGKCVAVNDAEWHQALQMRSKKNPSSIDLLSGKACEVLGVEGELPSDIVEAGFTPPSDIVAVVRPPPFNASAGNFAMNVVINFRPGHAKKNTVENVKELFSGNLTPVSKKGYQGLYIFSLKKELPNLFQKAGEYTFLFSLKELSSVNLEKSVRVRASSQAQSWQLPEGQSTAKFCTRVGSCLPPVFIGSYDKYKNRNSFDSDTKVKAKITSSKGLNVDVKSIKQYLSSDNCMLRIEDMLVESNELDKIRPEYEANLWLLSWDDLFSVKIKCQVIPGPPKQVRVIPINFGEKLLPGQIIQNFVLEIFDMSGNHAKEDEHIMLKLDGFCMQDRRDLHFKVDCNGCVELDGLVRVAGGYGKTVSFSVLSNGDVIYKKEFQTEIRELRAAFQVPIYGSTGTQLDNIVFEATDRDGEVDESIHNEDQSGQFHTLKIRSDSLNIDDSLRYSFCRGRCRIPNIYLPQREGTFSFEATHSQYPELSFIAEVHVEQAVSLENQDVLPPFSVEKNLLTNHPSNLVPLKLEFSDSSNQSFDRMALGTPDWSKASKAGHLVKCMKNYNLQEIEEDLCTHGVSIKQHEESMKLLSLQQSQIEQEITDLRAGLDLDYNQDEEATLEEELVLEKISYSSDSAAAVICRLLQSTECTDLGRDVSKHILGVVASLGTVQTDDLSRVLAKYLGDVQMLAIVCTSHAYAASLEKYTPDGQVNNSKGLYGLAALLGLSINKPFHVICLDTTSPYTGELSSDYQHKLALQDPVLPNGKPPPGYLGYAVNMINLYGRHFIWRSASGHGLRETLFYRVFGKVQVYENRKYMLSAKPCIQEDGAVSLDGGIMRGNGVIILGHCEPDIQFPVVSSESQTPCSCTPTQVEHLKMIEDKKQELRETVNKLETEQKSRTKALKKFVKKKTIFEKILEEKEELMMLDSPCKSSMNSPRLLPS